MGTTVIKCPDCGRPHEIHPNLVKKTCVCGATIRPPK